MSQPPPGKPLSDADYEAIAELKDLVGRHALSIVVSHHQRKAAGESIFDTASGTLGLTGSADQMMFLHKEAGIKYLTGTGRDMEEYDVAVD